jgi:hypothetical protein
MPKMPARVTHSARWREPACVAVLAAIFICFTWRGLTMFFSGDDMMNMYKAWTTPAWRIWKAQVLPWMPLYRPLGTAVYRVSYTIFGLHALPLYIFCWLLLVGNFFLAWRFFGILAPSRFVALIALSLTMVHGLFQDLYLSAGTIYDRLCFLFTVLAVIVYARARREENGMSPGRVALLCLICLMAMNSKENGAVVPAILFCYECIYYLPEVWRENRLRKWLRSIAPFYCLMAAVLAAFVAGRLRGTSDIAGNPAYRAHISLVFWLRSVTEYLTILLYRTVHFTGTSTALTLLAMLALAAILRNRAMLFGWCYFVLAVTPVALVSVRQGYVLYVPSIGLGLYFAEVIGIATGRVFRRIGSEIPGLSQIAILAVVTVLITWIHATHWPEPWNIADTPQWRLTEKMRRDYPTLKPGAKFLFVDDPSGNQYDLMFILRLLYHDPLIEVARLNEYAEVQPDRSQPLNFDHVFAAELETYLELDRRNVEESIRLNVLQDFAPGRYFDVDRADRAGYVVSGLLTSGRRGDGWWTTRSAKLKFDVYPADSRLTLKFFTPHSVATGKTRTLSVMVDGVTVGTVALTHEGMNDLRFAVPAQFINASDFTILELDVDDPYTEGGQEYGVVLTRAGFDYTRGVN